MNIEYDDFQTFPVKRKSFRMNKIIKCNERELAHSSGLSKSSISNSKASIQKMEYIDKSFIDKLLQTCTFKNITKI